MLQIEVLDFTMQTYLKINIGCAILFHATKSQETYQFPTNKNPYSQLSSVTNDIIAITLPKNGSDKSPHEQHLYYPDKPGKYPLVEVYGGLGALMPAFAYTDIINNLVSKGFIVSYPRLVVSEIDIVDPNDYYEAAKEQHDFLIENGNSIIETDSNGQVFLDSQKVGMICHSSGCFIPLMFAEQLPHWC